MKRLIIGVIIGMSIMAVGLEAYDWQQDMALQEQRRQTQKLQNIESQNQEIIRNQKNPC